MNLLYVGFHKSVVLPKRGFLLIDDEVPEIPRARVFDPKKHSFNPLKDISYKTARELANVLYTITPGGSDTLTVRNGRRNLLKALLDADRLDKVKGDEEVNGMISDILASPVLKGVLCKRTNFSFNPRTPILARINRKELGEFDALVLGLFLLGQYQGQVVVPDFGFYGRDMHIGLIREERLIAQINSFAEVSNRLKQNLLSMKTKIAKGANFDDAELLAKYEGFRAQFDREASDFNLYVDRAMKRE